MSNACLTYPQEGDNPGKPGLIPHMPTAHKGRGERGPLSEAPAWGGGRVPSARWWGNGPPRRRRVAGLRGWSATRGLRHGPDSYGRQQWGIFGNGRKPDRATPRAGRSPSGCKPLSGGKNPGGSNRPFRVTVPPEEGTANYVPAAAVIRRSRALPGFTGRKVRVGGRVCRP